MVMTWQEKLLICALSLLATVFVLAAAGACAGFLGARIGG
jgi:hypothetical protein